MSVVLCFSKNNSLVIITLFQNDFQHLPIPNYQTMLMKILGDVLLWQLVVTRDSFIISFSIHVATPYLKNLKLWRIQNMMGVYWTLNTRLYEKKFVNEVKIMNRQTKTRRNFDKFHKVENSFCYVCVCIYM